MSLPAPVRDFFERNGYYVARAVFSAAEIAVLESAFDRIVEQLDRSSEEINARWSGPEMQRLASAGTVVFHTHNVQQYSADWLRAIQKCELLDVAEALLGPDIVLHHTKLFQKPPEKGAPFPVHQDWSYFPTERNTMIAAVIHVSEATDEMGCLRVYPGSHKLGRVLGSSGQEESDLLARHPLGGATPLEAAPGDVVFFHYFTLHGSMPNRSAKTRKTVLVQMYAGDDRVEEGNLHTDERLVLRGWNHRATRSVAGGRKQEEPSMSNTGTGR